MTVRVELTQKQRLDNHRPEFRPTDSDKLYGSERTLATAVNKIADAIPESLVVDYIYGRVQATSLTRRITDLVEDDPTIIERPLFAAFQVGEADDAAQQRKDINRRLRELGANVRLRSKDELRKALDEIVWGPVLEDFNVTDPNAPARVHARLQSQRILTDLSRSTVDSIDVIIQNSFRVTQTFSTGRTVAGLTPTQTAQTILTALSEIGPTPTGADLAARTAVHTRGLFPRWALAVERSGNAAGYRAARNGASPERVLQISQQQMRRHGEKLRRARARMIARTEIAVAQNQGILAQQQALIDQGVVAPQSQKEWITGPFDVCPICTPLGGTRVGQADFFSWQGGAGFPPAHPNCRCKTRLVPTIDSAPQRVGTGTITDPFRYQFPDGWIAPIAGVPTVAGGDAAARLAAFQATARSDDLFGSAVLKRDASSQRDWLDNVAPDRIADAKRTGLYDEIARDGVREPLDVFVRPTSALKDGGPRFELATGHHRLAVAHDLGIDVPVRYYGKGFAEVTGHFASRQRDGSFGLFKPVKP